jgi:hypothetical protein
MSTLRRDVPESSVVEDPCGVACKREIMALKFRGGKGFGPTTERSLSWDFSC